MAKQLNKGKLKKKMIHTKRGNRMAWVKNGGAATAGKRKKSRSLKNEVGGQPQGTAAQIKHHLRGALTMGAAGGAAGGIAHYGTRKSEWNAHATMGGALAGGLGSMALSKHAREYNRDYHKLNLGAQLGLGLAQAAGQVATHAGTYFGARALGHGVRRIRGGK